MCYRKTKLIHRHRILTRLGVDIRVEYWAPAVELYRGTESAATKPGAVPPMALNQGSSEAPSVKGRAISQKIVFTAPLVPRSATPAQVRGTWSSLVTQLR